jgi:general secretion pathway protein G
MTDSLERLPGHAASAAERCAQRAAGERRKRSGFTLIEIMAVVIIMGLLMGIVGTAVFSQLDTARVNTTRAQLKQLESALAFYQMDNGRFPTTEQGLRALVEPPTIAPEPRSYRAGGYLQGGKVPMDAWSNPYQYEMPGVKNGQGFDLWSFGADGQPGGSGSDADIVNWSEPDEGT